MLKDFYQKNKKMLRFIFFFIAFFFISYVQLIPIVLFNIDLNNITETTEMLLSIFSSSVLVLLFYLAYKNELKHDWKDFKKNFMPYLDTAFKYWVIGLVVMALSNQIISIFSPIKMAENEQAVQGMIEGTPLLAFITTTILAPITEEMTFRKTFKDVLDNKWLFILMSGLTFGALHVVLSLDSLYSLLYIIPYSSLGISFAYILYKTKNIFSCIAMHAFHNGILTLMSIALSVLGTIL